MEQIRLGRKVRVSDPCYGTGVWCAGTIDNVKEGLYNVAVEMSDEGMWGNRVNAGANGSRSTFVLEAD